MPAMQKTMSELAVGIRNGSEQAFHLFFTRTYDRVVRYLVRTLSDNRFADDIAQEVFIRIWQNRERIDPAQPLEAWLFAIVRNTAATHLQKLLAERNRLRKARQSQLLYSEEIDSQPVVSNQGVSTLEYKDSLVLYHKALATINPERLHCFRLHREEGLTYHQIAATKGISVKTVEKHISFVVRSLRELLPSPNALVIIAQASCISLSVS